MVKEKEVLGFESIKDITIKKRKIYKDGSFQTGYLSIFVFILVLPKMAVRLNDLVSLIRHSRGRVL